MITLRLYEAIMCHYIRKALFPVLKLDRGGDRGLRCILPGGCSLIPAEKLLKEANSSLHSSQN